MKPSLARFLSDFTLGFSDGLTVPFALTAGLSSLGRSDTVLLAGLAELCAGSISMGIGGYLAAKDEAPRTTIQHDEQRDSSSDEESQSMLHHDGSRDEQGYGEKLADDVDEDLIRQHLEQHLNLPSSTVSTIIETIQRQQRQETTSTMTLEGTTQIQAYRNPHIRPVLCGLSISCGYVIGGAIPLVPYLFAATVGRGLCWSIALCLFALFAFGSGKRWILNGGDWTRWRACLWEGVQMLMLGTVAAGAAMACVRAVGNIGGGDD